MTSQHCKVKRWRPWRFKLRTAFVAVLAACVGLAWWFRPFVIVVEEEYPLDKSNTPRSVVVRRSLNGRLVHWGTVATHYDNGMKSAATVLYGADIDPTRDPIGDRRTRYWHEDGRELTRLEWCCFQTYEFLPREAGDEPLLTEAEWRADLRKHKYKYDLYDASLEANAR